MVEQFDFYTEVDPSLRIRIPETVTTIVFRRGHYRTGDPREIMTLQAHPDVIGPPDVEVELREPAVVPVEDEVITEVPELRFCSFDTPKGRCKILAKEGSEYCHVHLRKMREKEEEV